MKLAIVGAGARFTPELLADLLGRTAFAGASVALYDVELERPQVLERWGRRLTGERGADVHVAALPDLDAALAGGVAFTPRRRPEDAWLVVLDEHLSPRLTVVGGRIVFAAAGAAVDAARLAVVGDDKQDVRPVHALMSGGVISVGVG